MPEIERLSDATSARVTSFSIVAQCHFCAGSSRIFRNLADGNREEKKKKKRKTNGLAKIVLAQIALGSYLECRNAIVTATTQLEDICRLPVSKCASPDCEKLGVLTCERCSITRREATSRNISIVVGSAREYYEIVDQKHGSWK